MDTILCLTHSQKNISFCLTCSCNLCVRCLQLGTHNSHAMLTSEELKGFLTKNEQLLSQALLGVHISALSKSIIQYLNTAKMQSLKAKSNIITQLSILSKSNSKDIHVNDFLNLLPKMYNDILISQAKEIRKSLKVSFMKFQKNIVMSHPNEVFSYKGSILTLHNSASVAKSIKLSQPIIEKASSISYGKRIFFMGGYNSTPLNDVYECNYFNSQLFAKSPMKNKRFSHSLCAARSFIYSIGGHNGAIDLADCEKYDIMNDKWEQLPNLLTPRYCCAAFVWKFNVYSLCGFSQTKDSYLNSMEMLEEGKQWINLELLNAPSARECMVGVLLFDSVLVMGGWNGIECADAYVLKKHSGIWCCKKLEQDLVQPSEFWECPSPCNNGFYVYAMDHEMRLNTFNIELRKWA